MRFGPWHPLADAGVAAPEAPGVLQVRAERVVVYPTGKSAMVLYACTTLTGSLRAVATAIATAIATQAVSADARWIRFAPTKAPQEEHARLLAQFVERFGAFPLLNHLVNHGANAQ